MFMLALRAVVLDGRVFQEVKDRQEAMFSALGIVAVAGVALGLGVWSGLRDPGAVGFVAQEMLVLFVVISTIIFGWFLWTAFVWLLGARLFRGDAGFREIMRALGICYAPMWLSLLGGILPYLIIVGAVWTLVSGVNSVRNTLGLAWWQAAIAALIGWAWALVGMPVLMLSPYVIEQPV